ncbi:hypothetical protein ADUPG1_008104 [Aduncisulcus paluster]|uniref:Uncharacterized protein n=1 Tax=Aduncisulcus paluster TaxID=2918883 RepID=A0ABQ5KQR0_9EUKA|nr:hypothetical protein ADUPG1_008104 [Aduncisulcus paluster]
MHSCLRQSGDRSCPFCGAEVETQNHALGHCLDFMDDYRTRHHKVRDGIIKSIHKISPSTPLLSEQYSDPYHRPDIKVDFSAPTFIEVAVTYADASVGSLESMFRKKKNKYRDIEDLIVVVLWYISSIAC